MYVGTSYAARMRIQAFLVPVSRERERETSQICVDVIGERVRERADGEEWKRGGET